MENAIILKASLVTATLKHGTRIKVLNLMTGRQRMIHYDHAMSAKERVVRLLYDSYHIRVDMLSFTKNNDDLLVIHRKYADNIQMFFNRIKPS